MAFGISGGGGDEPLPLGTPLVMSACRFTGRVKELFPSAQTIAIFYIDKFYYTSVKRIEIGLISD